MVRHTAKTLKAWVATNRVRWNSLGIRTAVVSVALPISETKSPFRGGSVACVVRGRTVWCRARVWATLTSVVVLYRFCLTESTVVCRTL